MLPIEGALMAFRAIMLIKEFQAKVIDGKQYGKLPCH